MEANNIEDVINNPGPSLVFVLMVVCCFAWNTVVLDRLLKRPEMHELKEQAFKRHLMENSAYKITENLVKTEDLGIIEIVSDSLRLCSLIDWLDVRLDVNVKFVLTALEKYPEDFLLSQMDLVIVLVKQKPLIKIVRKVRGKGKSLLLDVDQILEKWKRYCVYIKSCAILAMTTLSLFSVSYLVSLLE